MDVKSGVITLTGEVNSDSIPWDGVQPRENVALATGLNAGLKPCDYIMESMSKHERLSL